MADLSSAVNNYGNLDVGGTTNQISTLIPHLTLASEAVFNYDIATGVDGDGELQFCLLATGTSAAGNSGGQIMFSSQAVSVTDSPTWENHIHRANYVDGSAKVAGGCCAADGTFNSTTCGGA